MRKGSIPLHVVAPVAAAPPLPAALVRPRTQHPSAGVASALHSASPAAQFP